jgi:hypothetical protein
MNPLLTTPAVRDRLILNMLQGALQQDNAYSRLDGYLVEFETGLITWPGP